MQYIFILLALVIFLAIIGSPILLIIWILIQKKKTEQFPLKKLFIVVIIIIAGIILVGSISSKILEDISNNFGTENLRLPDVRK